MRIFLFAIFVAAVLYGLHLSTSWFMRFGRIGGHKIARGTQCTWWDAVHKVAFAKQGKTPIPCCPHCGGQTIAVDESAWWGEVDAHETPGYRKLIERSRGKCFPSHAEMADHLTVGWSPMTMWRD